MSTCLKCLLIQEYRASEGRVGCGDVGGSYTVGGPILSRQCVSTSQPTHTTYVFRPSASVFQRNARGLTIRETDRERGG
ncbi:hypothetical protein QQF64_027162 [Cirrhinus molitorella]|uniref:Uncharacterized protein n=1 Tax=Cirrhinus molitorella TaxID=172907 RepID=A0ABR3NBN5_9TELE